MGFQTRHVVDLFVHGGIGGAALLCLAGTHLRAVLAALASSAIVRSAFLYFPHLYFLLPHPAYKVQGRGNGEAQRALAHLLRYGLRAVFKEICALSRFQGRNGHLPSGFFSNSSRILFFRRSWNLLMLSLLSRKSNNNKGRLTSQSHRSHKGICVFIFKFQLLSNA